VGLTGSRKSYFSIEGGIMKLNLIRKDGDFVHFRADQKFDVNITCDYIGGILTHRTEGNHRLIIEFCKSCLDLDLLSESELRNHGKEIGEFIKALRFETKGYTALVVYGENSLILAKSIIENIGEEIAKRVNYFNNLPEAEEWLKLQ
jgi:hypothetical protein